MADIHAFLAAEALRPFRWGETDCAATVDRWIAVATGISPLDRFGRRHRTEAEAQAWLNEPGGLLYAFGSVLSAHGLRRVQYPVPGDVGLVIEQRRLCSAIHAGSHWVSRDVTGFLAMPLDQFLKAWSICPQPSPASSCSA